QTPFYFDEPESAWALYFGKEGTLWIGTFKGNTYRLHPKTQQMKRIDVPATPSDEGASNMVFAFFEDPGGTLWAGTYGYGVYRFDAEAEAWVHSRAMTDVVGKQIVSSYKDRTGKLWVGTGAGLMHKRHKKAFGQLGGGASVLQGAASVWVADNKDVWVGTRGQGLIRVGADGTIVQQFTTENGDLLSDQVAAIIEDSEGAMWFATAGAGIARISPSGIVTPFMNDPNDSWSLGDNLVYDIYEDREQRLWVSTARGGLNLWDRSTERFMKYLPGGEGSISSNEVWTIFHDAAGDLWAGTQEGGLNRLHINDTGQFPPKIEFESFMADPQSSASLSSNNVVTISEYTPGQLELGTMGGGVNVMDIKKKSFTSYSKEEGVPNENVGCILVDNTGRKWLSTSNGLAYYNPADTSFTSFSVRDGLQSSVFNFNGCDVDDEGRFYMANEAGVTVFNPEEIELNTVPPKVVITDVYLFNEPFMPDTSASYKRRLVLPHDQNFLSFRFAALDFNIPEKNAYMYKMEGIDINWVSNLEGRIANYPNLPPGKYTFRVRGTNNDGIWSEEGAVMHIQITRPYWAQWWFVSLLSAIVLGIGYWVYDSRAKQRKREADMRQQIADDLHDDLGSNLGALSYFLDRMLQRNRLKPEDEETAQMYVSSVQKMIGDLDDVVWLADSGFDHLGSLVGRMQLAARILVSDTKLVFKADTFSEDLPIPMEIRRHLFLAFKEAVHNAVQHSDAQTIEIEVTQEASVVRVTVKDDGKGFIREELEEEGKGLDSLDRRGAHPRLTFSIDSQPGVGTAVMLEADMT
ncbi:MAG: ATP-binding protein, partial [Rhodothermaceae bacterium]|nr:ATP-binding protein [Rhodothermaceae bacterium]